MSFVTLICTVHEEIGSAHVSALCSILESTQPDVIFLEVPPEAFSEFYETCNRQNLESMAVARYGRTHQVRLVPIDLAAPSASFFSDLEYLRQRINNESSEYRRLIRWDTARISEFGFSYLNSEYSSSLWALVYGEMASTIERIDDVRLHEIFNLWNSTNSRRKTAMLKSIQTFCRENSAHKAAFLVGAAHRRHLMDLSLRMALLDSAEVLLDPLRFESVRESSGDNPNY
jgi:hypothetical protein